MSSPVESDRSVGRQNSGLGPCLLATLAELEENDRLAEVLRTASSLGKVVKCRVIAAQLWFRWALRSVSYFVTV